MQFKTALFVGAFTCVWCSPTFFVGGLTKTASAAVISVNGSGGAIPENNPLGATFSVVVDKGGIVEDLSLDLLNFRRFNPNPNDFFRDYGGIVDLIIRLKHLDTGTTATIISNPLNLGNFICIAGMNGNYKFENNASTALNQNCGTGGVFSQPSLIAPGSYQPVSNLSSLFAGKQAAGTWELFVSDVNINTGINQFITNSDWNWQLNIKTSQAVPESTSILSFLALGTLGAASTLKHKLKSSKSSEKKTKKVA